MGRKKVPRAEAAALLKCSERSLSNYTRRGLLTPVVGGGHRRSYYLDELEALQEALNDEQSLESLTVRVLQLNALCHSMKRRIESLETVLGFDVPILSHAKEDVFSEYWRAEDLSHNPVHQADVIRDYTKTLLGLHEEFLELVERYTDDREPWRVFLKAADALQQGAVEDEDLIAAQRQLGVVRNMLEQRAIQYVARRDGERAAYAAFPRTEPSVHQRVLARLPTPDHKVHSSH